MATLEIVAIVAEVVHLRQAGVARTAIEHQLIKERRVPPHAARRLIGQVDQELQRIRHRMALPLALSAESLQWDCVETVPKLPTRN